ncbi:hypothetical protein TEA_015079 [Camellia sinensis var. sinensis]|uniref:Uncharacterized protein n=1 Tax=Camellia sinensis var. sinensis TaxID=542762 RepID=A0A4S4DYA4_CAMSN|nr:hypothetical protein TEA_015079 [Camellia sinensis var. sinensis]
MYDPQKFCPLPLLLAVALTDACSGSLNVLTRSSGFLVLRGVIRFGRLCLVYIVVRELRLVCATRTACVVNSSSAFLFICAYLKKTNLVCIVCLYSPHHLVALGEPQSISRVPCCPLTLPCRWHGPRAVILLLSDLEPCAARSWILGWVDRSASGVHRSSRPFCRRCAPGLNWPGRASGAVTLKKLECSKQAYALDTLAWDNIIGFRSYYVGLRDRTFAKDVFINQERKLGARRRSDTVLVSTINDADQGSADVTFWTPLAPYEKSQFLGSGGSMVARLKLKGIDGRAPPGVEPAA